MTDLTLIFAAFNDQPTLRQMLAALAGQGCRFPIIIVDDCSVDDTGEMVAEISATTDLAVTYLRNERNMGPGPTRNSGVHHCQTKYFAFLDADDFIKPHYVHYLSQIVTYDFDVAIIKYDISRNRRVHYTGHMHRVDSLVLNQFWDAPSPLIEDREEIWGFCGMIAFPWNKIYSRAFYNRIGAAFPDRRLHEDILPHWQVLLYAEALFFDYAIPSLLTHFEIADGTRATNAKSHSRLEAYADLVDVLSQVQNLPSKVPFESFVDFVSDLDDWIMKEIRDEDQIPVALQRLRLDLLTRLKIRL